MLAREVLVRYRPDERGTWDARTGCALSVLVPQRCYERSIRLEHTVEGNSKIIWTERRFHSLPWRSVSRHNEFQLSRVDGAAITATSCPKLSPGCRRECDVNGTGDER